MNGMHAVVSEFRTRRTTEFRKPVQTLVQASWENPDGSLQTVPRTWKIRPPVGQGYGSRHPSWWDLS
jgi:hypothetical protein